MIRPLKFVLPAAAVLTLVWFVLPAGIEPVVWTPPPQPLEGAFAKNDLLKDIQRLDVGVDAGPAAIAVDAVERLYVGYADGRILRFESDGASYVEVAKVDERPLAMSFDPHGELAVADGKRGLLHVDASGDVDTYHLRLDPPAHAVTDVERGLHDVSVYLTDASATFTPEQSVSAWLDHRADGRLIVYSVGHGPAKVLLSDLAWPSGVTLGPDDEYILVSESMAYRITRYWLKGEKAGTHEVFADNLPGTPGDLSFNGTDRFWVAMTGPRRAAVDSLADKPWLRRLAARLPAFLQGWVQGGDAPGAFVLGYDTSGKLIANLQYAGSNGFGRISNVEEHGPWLYVGSPAGTSLGRFALNRAIASVPPPLPGAELIAAHPQAKARHDEKYESEDIRHLSTAAPDPAPAPPPR